MEGLVDESIVTDCFEPNRDALEEQAAILQQMVDNNEETPGTHSEQEISNQTIEVQGYAAALDQCMEDYNNALAASLGVILDVLDLAIVDASNKCNDDLNTDMTTVALEFSTTYITVVNNLFEGISPGLGTSTTDIPMEFLDDFTTIEEITSFMPEDFNNGDDILAYQAVEKRTNVYYKNY